ncbi:hypothetical protein EVAR_83934_1 [Eumeta japonica]|uniref:F-box/LRR-repeat protein 15-like leucin rich repeat domain-containing protein n=1 Tax=Eumeta variegata TaxID=151549 RepID=A0A4C1XUA5_EUMVA|nr:hypothetical protein EVAR_83934_1 [Eumeta japonica]
MLFVGCGLETKVDIGLPQLREVNNTLGEMISKLNAARYVDTKNLDTRRDNKESTFEESKRDGERFFSGRNPPVSVIFFKVTVPGAQLLAASFRHLTHLALTASPSMDGRALAPLVTELHELRHLDLTGCPSVDWPDWSWLEGRLAARSQLEYVDLTDCVSVTDAGLCALLHTCPSLQYLYLRRCTLVTDAGVRWIPSYCALKELSVSDCAGVTDFALYELAKLGPALRYLSVAKCIQVSDSGISTLARRCYRLRYLNARGCCALGDDGVEAIAKGCSRLRALDLGATDVGERGLQILARCCPNLKKLALRGCELITDEGLEAVAYYCRGLTQLNIQDTPVTARGCRVWRFLDRKGIERKYKVQQFQIQSLYNSDRVRLRERDEVQNPGLNQDEILELDSISKWAEPRAKPNE